jgi:hypothetical protein
MTGEEVPSASESALLLAARQGRLRRFYYIDSYVDGVTSTGMGGGGKANPKLLQPMAERGWLIEPPAVSEQGVIDALWQVTVEGNAARSRFLARPGTRKRGGSS